MSTPKNTPLVIGVSGYARAGKDTFVKVASKIVKQLGYTTSTHSFARGLKDDLDEWLKDKYGISAWTDNTEEKQLIRPFLVAHGCGKRTQTQGKYWIDKVDEQIRNSSVSFSQNHVCFVSDVRFLNEANWLHNSWSGWLVHLKKYKVDITGDRIYDSAPNDEEAKNDPLVLEQSDVRLELEEVIAREKAKGNIITVDDLIDNSYLNEEIRLCLSKHPAFSMLATTK